MVIYDLFWLEWEWNTVGEKSQILLEANQNKNNNNWLVSNFYNKLKFPALFSVQNRREKSAADFNLLEKLLTRQLFLFWFPSSPTLCIKRDFCLRAVEIAASILHVEMAIRLAFYSLFIMKHIFMLLRRTPKDLRNTAIKYH